MKKEWKKYTDVRQSVFQNHFSETNSKGSIEEKAAVTSSMKDSLFFFCTYECELVCVLRKLHHPWKYGRCEQSIMQYLSKLLPL